MPTIIINSEEELKQKFIDLVHTVHNMRFYQKYWKENYGYNAKERMKYWETKVDAILNQLGLKEHQNTKVIYIENNV